MKAGRFAAICALVLLFSLAGCSLVIKPETRPAAQPSANENGIKLTDAISYTLRLEDMPTGFTLDSEDKLHDNEYVAKGFPDPDKMQANLKMWGREGGYFRTYILGGLAALMGTGRVDSSAIVYGSGPGAQGYMDAWVENEKATLKAGKYLSFKAVSSPSVGDASMAFITTFMGKMNDGKEYNQTRYTALFRRHNLLVIIETYSLNGAGNFSDALGFAQTIEKKIK